MGFLQRSKSAATTNRRSRRKCSNPPLPGPVPAAVAVEEKRAASFERPKTADTSFSRPRTANAAIGRLSDWASSSFTMDVKAENEVFSFPMPSPCILQTLDGPVVKKRPSPLQELGSPAIGVAIGSPSQAPTHTRPAWGRPVTADSVSPRMPAQPAPSRAPPAVPSHVDLDILSNDALKKRKSAWKSLGGLFCRRQTIVHAEEPLYRVKMPNAIGERDIIIPDLAELAEHGSTPTYGPRRSSLLPPPQACLDASNTTLKPAGLTIVTRSPLAKESFSPMFRTINGIPDDDVWIDDPRKDSPLSMMSPNSFRREEQKHDGDLTAPQLEILDLPDPKFERYSVMFEKLLLESCGPSLLERRQSKLKRNRSIKKLDLFPTLDQRQEIPRLEVNGVPQRSATSPNSLAKSLSVRIGKKVLSPVAEACTALSQPYSIRRSKTAPSPAISPRSPNFPNPRIEVQCTSPASFCGTECSLPLTPMTFTTISDSGSIEVIETDVEPVRRSMQDPDPSWDMMPPPLRVKPSEKRVVHVSVARQVSVNSAAEQVRESSESSARQPLRARMVELGKNCTSAAVLIEIAEE